MKKLNVKLPQGGSKRALHSGMYASALAVVVLAVIILVNLVIRALPTKYTEYDISTCLLYTSPSPRDPKTSRMPSSA